MKEDEDRFSDTRLRVDPSICVHRSLVLPLLLDAIKLDMSKGPYSETYIGQRNCTLEVLDVVTLGIERRQEGHRSPRLNK